MEHQHNQEDDDDDADIPGAFFTQSDWTGKISRETWYGKHHPWRRILAFVMLSAWSSSASLLVWMYTEVFPADVPIMDISLTPHDLWKIKMTHYNCFHSLCDDIGRTTAVDCLVSDDGFSAKVELAEYQSPAVFFTEDCHIAIDATFGYRYLDGDEKIGARPIALVNIQTEEIPANATASTKEHSAAKTSILTLLPDCSITVNASPDMNPEEREYIRKTLNVDMSEWESTINGHYDKHKDNMDLSVAANLMGLPNDAKPPGYRESNVLKKLFCPEEMASEVQELILPSAGTIYNLVIDCRHVILAVGLSLYSYCMSLGTLVWLMLRVLWPAWVMKRFLSWPESIDYWHIWRSLLLLCLLSSFHANSLVLTAAMTAGACYYRNTQAATEWAMLGVLAWSATDVVYPVLDSFLGGDGGLQQKWQQIDFLGIVPWSIHLLVVGEGWWKLVTLYVVGRSYQSLRQSLQQADVELEQTQLDMNPEQQQRQQPPYNNEHARAKVD